MENAHTQRMHSNYNKTFSETYNRKRIMDKLHRERIMVQLHQLKTITQGISKLSQDEARTLVENILYQHYQPQQFHSLEAAIMTLNRLARELKAKRFS